MAACQGAVRWAVWRQKDGAVLWTVSGNRDGSGAPDVVFARGRAKTEAEAMRETVAAIVTYVTHVTRPL